jgi:hypothetical protein
MPRSNGKPATALFLDIDGVLNCETTPGNLTERLDPVMIARLDEVVEATGAQVVISSAWRFMGWQRVADLLKAAGMKHADRIVDETPRLLSMIRGHEIGEWLAEHPEVTQWAIVDDDKDMGNHINRLVQTSWRYGLQDEHAARLIAMLKGNR